MSQLIRLEQDELLCCLSATKDKSLDGEGLISAVVGLSDSLEEPEKLIRKLQNLSPVEMDELLEYLSFMWGLIRSRTFAHNVANP
jgi:hypothetical protein